MKSMKLSIVTAVMVMSGFVVEVGAADVTASSSQPTVFYNDTDYTAKTNEWKTYTRVNDLSTGSGNWILYDYVSGSYPIYINAYTMPVSGIANSHYALWSKADGDVCLAKDALCINRSANDYQSVYVDSNGDIGLAGAGVVIDRSTRSVGIGGVFPHEKVDVQAVASAARFQLTSVTDTGNEAAQFIQRRSRVSGAIKNYDNIGLFSFRGHNGSGLTGSKAVISVAATEDWTSSKNGNQISFRHTPNGSSTMVTALQVKGNADVYIPNGNLYVKGSKMNVPDYVFDENYKLMPLDELKAYVKKNNHLPGVVSADEVDKAGVVNLSGLQMTLLEKVEELTLYTLQQEEALKAKDAEIKEMQAEITEIKSMKQKIAQLESLLTNLALDTSASDKAKVSMR